MAGESKTKATTASVEDYLAAVEPEQRRADAVAIDRLMRRVTGEKPAMWGASMVGYGSHHYKYESGREGDMFNVGFAARKTSLVLYAQGATRSAELLEKLGKVKTGVGCIYVSKLSDIDLGVLEELVRRSYAAGAS